MLSDKFLYIGTTSAVFCLIYTGRRTLAEEWNYALGWLLKAVCKRQEALAGLKTCPGDSIVCPLSCNSNLGQHFRVPRLDIMIHYLLVCLSSCCTLALLLMLSLFLLTFCFGYAVYKTMAMFHHESIACDRLQLHMTLRSAHSNIPHTLMLGETDRRVKKQTSSGEGISLMAGAATAIYPVLQCSAMVEIVQTSL